MQTAWDQKMRLEKDLHVRLSQKHIVHNLMWFEEIIIEALLE